MRADNATKSIQSAIDACTAAGGGIVYVPPGAYTIGAIHLKDNVNLYLEGGATLFLSQDPADFAGRARSMINSAGAHNIAVTGRGTLDGLAQYEYVDMRGKDPEIEAEREIARAAGVAMKRYYRTGMQTYMFILNDSTDVRLEGITVLHSPLWNVRLNGCDRVFIRGVHIYSDLEKGVNSDGIDIVSSSNVTISDSIVVTADDAIVIKTQGRGGAPAKPAEHHGHELYPDVVIHTNGDRHRDGSRHPPRGLQQFSNPRFEPGFRHQRTGRSDGQRHPVLEHYNGLAAAALELVG